MYPFGTRSFKAHLQAQPKCASRPNDEKPISNVFHGPITKEYHYHFGLGAPNSPAGHIRIVECNRKWKNPTELKNIQCTPTLAICNAPHRHGLGRHFPLWILNSGKIMIIQKNKRTTYIFSGNPCLNWGEKETKIKSFHYINKEITTFFHCYTNNKIRKFFQTFHPER